MSILQELLKRVEAATGPDREIDTAIWLQIAPGATRSQWSYIHKASARECFVDETRDATGRWITTPAYTGILDAAVGLVEKMLPGWTGHLDFGGSQACGYVIRPLTEGPLLEHRAFGATPALALCAALLRALIASETQNEKR